LKQITAEPENSLHRLIYADWLEERGDPRAELLRIQEQLRSLDVPARPQVEARMHELLNQGVQPLTITRTSSAGGELVLIFPGSFRMGSPPDEEDRDDDEDQVEVTLTRAFWLGRTVVTQREWLEVMDTAPWIGKEYVKEGDKFPATCVSWEAAAEFCRKLTAREQAEGLLSSAWEFALPTEAQWEYACRAGTESRLSFGDEAMWGEYAWFAANTDGVGEEYAHEVGQKKRNPWELFDIHGNVWEWCRDWYCENQPGGANPEQLGTRATDRVIRGGGWINQFWSCGSVDRSRSTTGDRFSNLGFRPTVQQVAR